MEEARFAKGDIQAKQLELIAARVVDEVRVDDGSVQERLRALSAPDVVKTCAMIESVSTQLQALHVVSTFDNRSHSFGDVQAAAAIVQDSSHQVANALCTFLAGRRLLTAAQDHAAMLERASKRGRFVGSLLARVEDALPGAGETCDWKALASAWDVCDAKLDEEGVAKQPEVVDEAAHGVLLAFVHPGSEEICCFAFVVVGGNQASCFCLQASLPLGFSFDGGWICPNFARMCSFPCFVVAQTGCENCV